MSAAKTSSLLIADDDELVRHVTLQTLATFGLRADGFATGDALLEALHDQALVCVVDLLMPGRNGLDCLREIRRRNPQTQVILVTGVNNAREAVAALKAGAFDYLTKPYLPAELARSVHKAMTLALQSRHHAELRDSVGATGPAPVLIGDSPAMAAVRDWLAHVGATNETVLLTGESGTGKSLAARVLHAASARAAGPFVSVSCPSLPRDLLESEMFGHEKGAFSGAIKRRLGRVELAAGGTLFLDEIADLPLELQAKLLTFLQEHTFFRVGGEAVLHADVRVVAATHRDLAQLCREGRFREDLLYRLNVVPLRLPALRDRAEDIAALAADVLAGFARRNGTPPLQLAPDALLVLRAHAWPGNVRELENTLARAATLHRDGPILHAAAVRAALPAAAAPAVPAPAAALAAGAELTLAGRTMGEIEEMALRQALAACGQSRARAARMLGISEKTVYNMLRRFENAAAPEATRLAG